MCQRQLRVPLLPGWVECSRVQWKLEGRDRRKGEPTCTRLALALTLASRCSFNWEDDLWMIQMHRCSIWITHWSDPDSLEAVRCLFHHQQQQQQLVSVFAPFSPYLIDLFISGYLTKSANQCYSRASSSPWGQQLLELTGSADKCSWDKLDWACPVSWGCIGGPESKGNKRNADFESLWFALWAENFKFANPKITETF